VYGKGGRSGGKKQKGKGWTERLCLQLSQILGERSFKHRKGRDQAADVELGEKARREEESKKEGNNGSKNGVGPGTRTEAKICGRGNSAHQKKGRCKSDEEDLESRMGGDARTGKQEKRGNGEEEQDDRFERIRRGGKRL